MMKKKKSIFSISVFFWKGTKLKSSKKKMFKKIDAG